jgi:hypothetical protein
LRDGRGGPKAEAAPGANEYVAVETQGASGGGGGGAAAPKQQKKKKEKQKEVVGEAVVEMSDADMLNSMRRGADAAAETESARSARAEKLSDSVTVADKADYHTERAVHKSGGGNLTAAAAGLFAAAGGAKPAGDDWEMVEKGDATAQLQKFMDECHTIICGFIKGRGHKVPEVIAPLLARYRFAKLCVPDACCGVAWCCVAQEHVRKHMQKLGLKKLCEALEQKYEGHAPRMELAGAFTIFDVNGDDMVTSTVLSDIMKECQFGGPKLKGLKVSSSRHTQQPASQRPYSSNLRDSPRSNALLSLLSLSVRACDWWDRCSWRRFCSRRVVRIT